MSHSYGMKRDFGLHGGGVFLPDLHNTGVASPSQSTSSYSSTMPAYNLHEHRGRGQHGKLSISEKDTAQKLREVEPLEKKKERGWFRGKRKQKASEKGSGPLQSAKRDLVEEGSAASPSPLLLIRSVTASTGDPSGRPQLQPGELGEEERMKYSYEAPEGTSTGPTHLIRLTLHSKKAARPTDTLTVTLRKRGTGFGLHLSTGLPPITVTYVEPGGEAEAAGVRVGDVVVEVNGERCESDVDAAKVMALKMLIQQTKITDKNHPESGSDSEEEEAGLNDSAWKRIQERQLRDEMESQTSSNVELTQIDDVPDTEATMSKLRKKAEQQKMKVEISATEWERMKQQRELIFDHNAPSTVIHQKGKEREKKRSHQSDNSPPSTSPQASPPGQGSGDRITSNATGGERRKRSRSLSSWFRRKKKTSSASDLLKETSAEKVSPKEHEGGRRKRGSFWRKRRDEGKREKVSEKRLLPSSDGSGDGEGGGEKGGGGGGGGGGEGGEGGEGGGKREEDVNQFTRIDDEKEEEEEEEEKEEKKGKVEKKEIVKKMESSVVQNMTTSHTSSWPRSQSHHVTIQSATSDLSGQQHTPEKPVLPVIAHQRSKSYQLNLGEEGGGGGGGGGRELQEARLGKEGRPTSRSQSDISEGGSVGGVGIDPNLRVRKSGVVIGLSSRGSARRPSLEMFESAEGREKGKGKGKGKGRGKREGKDVTDGPQAAVTPSPNIGPSSRGSTQRPSLEMFESAEGREKGKGKGKGKGKREGKDVTDGPQAAITPSPNIGPSSRGSTQRPSLEMFESAEGREKGRGKGKGKGKGKREGKDVTDGPQAAVTPSPKKVSAVDLDLAAIPHTHPSLGVRPGHTRRDLVARSSRKRRPPSNRETLLLGVADAEKMGRKRVELSRDSSPRARTSTMPEKITRRTLELTPVSGPTSSLPRNPASRQLIKELHEENMNAQKRQQEVPGSPSLQKQSSTTSTGSTAAIVAKAVAAKKQLSSSNSEERKSLDLEEGEGSLHSAATGGTGDVLAQRRREKVEAEVKKKEEEEEGGTVGGRDEASPLREGDSSLERTGRSSRPTSASRSRRSKTVEKPVKSLGIASEESSPTSSQQPTIPKINLRKTPKAESKAATSSSSSTPSWVAMAEQKKKRVSAILVGEVSPATKKEGSGPESLVGRQPSSTTATPTVTTSPPPTVTTSPPPSVTTSPPPTVTTSPPPTHTTSHPASITTSPPPSLTTSHPAPITTSPSPSLPTSHPTPITTSPPPSLTTSHSTPVTTSPPTTTTTSTQHSVTSTPRSHGAQTKEGHGPSGAGLPRKGTVKDRLALFQK